MPDSQQASTDIAVPPIFKDERKRTFLNPDGADKPLISPLGSDVLNRARAYRLQRIREQLTANDCAAILLYDPVNIRYALDSVNMSIWTMHNASRYALIFADGPAVLFEFHGAEHVNDDIPLIDEIREAKAWIYVTSGEHLGNRVEVWADEIADLFKEKGRNRKLAVDKLEHLGVAALEQRGVEIIEGQKLTEHARTIKNTDELALMRWTIRVAEAGMARIYEASEPGKTEREIWAELHYENARSGGEWLETKLLTSGPRTNPWYRECSDAVVQSGEMLAFDTDMIGPYGYCADLSRSWTIGHVAMNSKQRELYSAALEQIEHNTALLLPGRSFKEFNELSWRIPEKYAPYRYTVAAHGTGMADEWPWVLLHPDFEKNHSGEFEENMVVSVESLIAEPGSESIKLETQVLITANGPERLDTFPWEDI